MFVSRTRSSALRYGRILLALRRVAQAQELHKAANEVLMSGSLYDNKFMIEIEMDDGRLHDTLVSAIESAGGCCLWASIDVGEHQPGWVNYFTAKLTVLEDSSGCAQHGKQYELSLDKLKTGLRVMASKYMRHFADAVTGNGDIVTGNVLVQCALFGEIVYC